MDHWLVILGLFWLAKTCRRVASTLGRTVHVRKSLRTKQHSQNPYPSIHLTYLAVERPAKPGFFHIHPLKDRKIRDSVYFQAWRNCSDFSAFQRSVDFLHLTRINDYDDPIQYCNKSHSLAHIRSFAFSNSTSTNPSYAFALGQSVHLLYETFALESTPCTRLSLSRSIEGCCWLEDHSEDAAY